MSAYKSVQRTTTLSAAVADAVSELQALGEECREVCDNTPDSLQSTDRYSSLDDAASALESLDEPEVPDYVADLPCAYVESVSTRRGRSASRATRRDNAVAMLTAAIDVVSKYREGLKDGPPVAEGSDEADTLAQKVSDCEDLESDTQQIVDDAEGLEFPGMRG